MTRSSIGVSSRPTTYGRSSRSWPPLGELDADTVAAWNSTGSVSPTRIRPRPGVRRGTLVALPVPINAVDSRSSDKRSATRSPIAGALAKSSRSDGCSVATIRWMPSRWPSAAISSSDDTSCGCSVATAAGSSTTMTSRGNATPRHARSSRPSSSARSDRMARSARWASETSWCITTCGSDAHAANVDRPARSRSANVSAPGGRPAASPTTIVRSISLLPVPGAPPMSVCGPSRSRSISTGPAVRHSDRDAGMRPLRSSPASGRRASRRRGWPGRATAGWEPTPGACSPSVPGGRDRRTAPTAAPSRPRWVSRGGTTGRHRPSSVHPTTRRARDRRAVR